MREMGRSARELLLPILLVGLGLLTRLAVAIPWNARHGDGESRLRYGDEPSYALPVDSLWWPVLVVATGEDGYVAAELLTPFEE